MKANEYPKLYWHNSVIGAYENYKFTTLLHEHNVKTSTPKRYEIVEEEATDMVFVEGFLAEKDRKSYLISKEDIDLLPIRIPDKVYRVSEQGTNGDSRYVEETVIKSGNKVVGIIHNPVSFRIPTNQAMTFKQLVDSICPFDHENPDGYKLYTLIMLSAWLDKVYTRICSVSEFGKDGLNSPLQSLLQDYRVCSDLKTVPALLREINPNGVIIFNEACGGINKQVRDTMEGFILDAADGKNIFKNRSRASAAHGTKDFYRIDNESVVAIYNTINQYKTQKNYFDYQFDNNDAVKSRLLPIMMTGKMTEDFNVQDVDFYAEGTTESAQSFYRDVLTTLQYYKVEWPKMRNKYGELNPLMDNRHKQTFDRICKTIAVYSPDKETYVKYTNLLLDWNENYYRMLKGDFSMLETKEEEEEPPHPMEAYENNTCKTTTIVEEVIAEHAVVKAIRMLGRPITCGELAKIENGERDIDKLIAEGEIVEDRTTGTFSILE